MQASVPTSLYQSYLGGPLRVPGPLGPCPCRIGNPRPFASLQSTSTLPGGCSTAAMEYTERIELSSGGPGKSYPGLSCTVARESRTIPSCRPRYALFTTQNFSSRALADPLDVVVLAAGFRAWSRAWSRLPAGTNFLTLVPAEMRTPDDGAAHGSGDWSRTSGHRAVEWHVLGSSLRALFSSAWY